MSSNVSCASEDNVIFLQSLNYRIAYIFAHTSILATFFTSLIAIHLLHTKSIFQSSTRIILYFNVFFVNIHQILYATEMATVMYKSLFMLDDVCSWMQREEDCVPYSTLLFMGISGMVYSQTGLMIERAFATFYANYTTSLSRNTGITVSITVLVCSVSTFRVIIWNDPLDGYVLSCFTVPGDSLVRMQIFLFVCVILSLFNLATSMFIMHYNKNQEYQTRFKIRERFKKREAIDSTHTICVISMGQFVTLFIYSFGMFILKCYITTLTLSQYLGLAIWLYTLPYSALLFPLILIYRIRATKASRTRKIHDITATNTRQTQDDHIKQMNRMWE